MRYPHLNTIVSNLALAGSPCCFVDYIYAFINNRFIPQGQDKKHRYHYRLSFLI